MNSFRVKKFFEPMNKNRSCSQKNVRHAKIEINNETVQKKMS